MISALTRLDQNGLILALQPARFPVDQTGPSVYMFDSPDRL